MLQVAPDYSRGGTAEELKKDFAIFATCVAIAPGFYLTDTETVLVVAQNNESRWKFVQPEGTLFVAHVWNCPLHETIFGVSTAPTRVDDRS